MEYNRHQLKYNARLTIFSRDNHALIASIAVFLLLYALSWLLVNLSGYAEWFSAYYSSVVSLANETGVMKFVPYTDVPWPRATTLSYAFCVVIAILRIVLNAGYPSWCLQAVRGEKPPVKAVFDGFAYFGSVFVLQLVRAVLTTIGLCVFVIPGLWVIYRYRLALYVFYDEPSLGAFGALKKSAALSRGRKMRMLGLDLSFILWYIISEIVAAFFLPVVDIWVRPYTGLTFAYYYEHVLACEAGAEQ